VFHSPTAIRHHARQLLDARSRIRDADRLMGELRDVLLSGDAPAAAAVGRLAWVPPPARQPSEVTGAVVMPVRFHRHRAGKRGAA
jgi:hypothetical protein